jgi:hypothetical protein
MLSKFSELKQRYDETVGLLSQTAQRLFEQIARWENASSHKQSVWKNVLCNRAVLQRSESGWLTLLKLDVFSKVQTHKRRGLLGKHILSFAIKNQIR